MSDTAETKRGRGRPADYRPEYADQAKKLCDLGATDEDLADFFKVTIRTVNRWKTTYADFCHALKDGKASADDRVERSLYQRALGYSYDAIHFTSFQGVVTATPYREHCPPDTTAAIFWLKNRRKEQWRDRVEIDARVTVKPAEQMSDDELAAIAVGGGVAVASSQDDPRVTG